MTGRHRLTVAVVVGGAIGIGACRPPARSPGPAPVDVIDVALEARLLAALDRRIADTAAVDAALGSAHPATRSRALLAIGQLKVRARYPQLRRLLLDGDTAVAANAAFAIGIGRDSAGAAALVRAIAGAPDPVAREAAWALGELGEAGRASLTDVLGMTLADARRASPAATRAPAVRAAAVLALAKLRPVPLAALLPWFGDSAVDVVRAAAYVAGRVRLPGAVHAVLPLGDAADEETRQHVARALTRATAGDSLDVAARRVLTALVRDPSERVRINAVRSLETFGPSAAGQVLPLLRDPVANVRVAASEAFADVAGRDTVLWRAAWGADTALAVRRVLLAQVRRLGLPFEPAVERDWAQRPDWQYRSAALGEGGTGIPRDTAVARQLLADPDPRVQRIARQRLGQRDSTSRRARTTATPTRPLEDYARLVRQWVVPGARQPQAVIETDRGRIVVELAAREAPLVVEAFLRLARTGVYRNTVFHRVVPNFVVQDGDPAGDGSGDAGFTLRESWTRRRHDRGCLGLATAGPDTGGSQYYLCHAPQPHLDGAYTVFGHVIEGLDVMDRIVQGDRMRRVSVP